MIQYQNNPIFFLLSVFIYKAMYALKKKKKPLPTFMIAVPP